jgi:hypothetical protein
MNNIFAMSLSAAYIFTQTLLDTAKTLVTGSNEHYVVWALTAEVGYSYVLYAYMHVCM